MMTMRKMSISPTPPHGEGYDLRIEKFNHAAVTDPHYNEPVAVRLSTEELEELARVTLLALGADMDEAEDAIDRARDLRAEAETSQEQLPL